MHHRRRPPPGRRRILLGLVVPGTDGDPCEHRDRPMSIAARSRDGPTDRPGTARTATAFPPSSGALVPSEGAASTVRRRWAGNPHQDQPGCPGEDGGGGAPNETAGRPPLAVPASPESRKRTGRVGGGQVPVAAHQCRDPRVRRCVTVGGGEVTRAFRDQSNWSTVRGGAGLGRAGCGRRDRSMRPRGSRT